MLSVVVPHYRDLSGLQRLLASIELERAKSGAPLSVTVVDDASPGLGDALRRSVRQRPWVNLLIQSENRGPAAARNRGARESHAEWIWFLDADVSLRPGAVAGMVSVLGSVATAGVLCGVEPKDPAGDSFRRYKNYLEFAWQPGEGESRSMDSKSFAIRREIFWAVGGFDERLREAGVEDYELAYRLFDAGHRIHFTHHARITHRHPTFLRQGRLFYERARDWMALKSTYGYQFDEFGTSAHQAVVELVCFAILLAFAAALWWPPALIVGLALLVVWAGLERRTLSLLAHSGEKPAFFARFLFYSCALSAPVVTGAAVGLVRAKVRR